MEAKQIIGGLITIGIIIVAIYFYSFQHKPSDAQISADLLGNMIMKAADSAPAGNKTTTGTTTASGSVKKYREWIVTNVEQTIYLNRDWVSGTTDEDYWVYTKNNVCYFKDEKDAIHKEYHPAGTYIFKTKNGKVAHVWTED